MARRGSWTSLFHGMFQNHLLSSIFRFLSFLCLGDSRDSLKQGNRFEIKTASNAQAGLVGVGSYSVASSHRPSLQGLGAFTLSFSALDSNSAFRELEGVTRSIFTTKLRISCVKRLQHFIYFHPIRAGALACISLTLNKYTCKFKRQHLLK